MKIKLILMLMLGALLLPACAPAASLPPTPNVPLIETAAAQTVIANFTLTALSSTATPLPPPTFTALPLNSPTAGATVTLAPTLPGGITATPTLCDALTFGTTDVDVNVPDNTTMTAGQNFVKTWKVKNNGSCTWGTGYGLVYGGYSDTMSGKAQAFVGPVVPGQTVEVSVQFIAPNKPGQYVSAWQMANASGKPFPKIIFVKIIVK
jgi:Ig-like domain from next to BRCA1 gene